MNCQPSAFGREVLGTFGARVLLLLTGLSSSIIIARVLGPHWKGVFTIAFLVPNTIIMLGTLGIGTSATYLIGRQVYPLPLILKRVTLIGLTLGVLYFAVSFLVFRTWKASLFTDVSLFLMVVASLAVPIGLMLRYAEYIFLGTGDIRFRNRALVVQGVAQILLLPVLLLWPLRMGVEGVGLGRILSSGAALGAAVIWIGLLLRSRANVGSPKDDTGIPLFYRRLFGFGFRSYVSTVVMFLNYRADILMLRIFHTDTDVGLYSVSVSLAELLWYLPGAFGTVFLSRSSRHLSGDLAARSVRVMIYLSGILASVLAVIAPWGISILFGQDYTGSVLPFRILLAGVIAVTVLKILNPELAGRGRPGVGSAVFFVALVLNIVLNVVWIPRWGVSGAALASTVSYTVGSAAFILLYTRITKCTMRELFIPTLQDFRDVGAQLRRIVRGGLLR